MSTNGDSGVIVGVGEAINIIGVGYGLAGTIEATNFDAARGGVLR